MSSEDNNCYQLKFQQKILRSDNNAILVVPNLTSRNLIPCQIDFDSKTGWNFEAVLKTNSQELVKLTQAFFQHERTYDLRKCLYKLEEGEKLELHIKPKSAPKDIDLHLTYTYTPCKGGLFYQNIITLLDLPKTTVLADITHKTRPTLLKIASTEPINSVKLIPNFTSPEEYPVYEKVYDTGEVRCAELDFDEEPLESMIEMLKYYQIKLQVDAKQSMDSRFYVVCYGFKTQ